MVKSKVAILAVLLLNLQGFTLYKKVMDKRFKEAPLESLVAAIQGIGIEMGRGKIAKTYFEKGAILFVDGARIEDIRLALILDRIRPIEALKGVYLLNKLEKLLLRAKGNTLGEKISESTSLMDRIIENTMDVPDFLTPAIKGLMEKFGPMFPEILEDILKQRLKDDPYLVAILWPDRFFEEMLKILGWTSVEQFILFLWMEVCSLYPRIPKKKREDVLRTLKNIQRKISIKDRKNIVIAWRDFLETIIDVIMNYAR